MISPVRAAVFFVNMPINTPQGRAYAFSEIKSWLEETGFNNIHQQEYPVEPNPRARPHRVEED